MRGIAAMNLFVGKICAEAEAAADAARASVVSSMFAGASITTRRPTRRPEAARAILESADADAQGRIDFKAFCQVMLPRGPDVDPSLAVRVAEYMSKSFV